MTDALVVRWGIARVRAAAIMLGGAAGALARAGTAEALPTTARRGRGRHSWSTLPARCYWRG